MQGKCCRHIAEGEMYIVTHTAGEAVGAAAVVAFWYRCISRQSWSVRYRRETHVWRSPLKKHGSIAARLPHNGAAAHPNMFGLGWQYGQYGSKYAAISGRRLLEELPADQDAPDLCGVGQHGLCVRYRAD